MSRESEPYCTSLAMPASPQKGISAFPKSEPIWKTLPGTPPESNIFPIQARIQTQECLFPRVISTSVLAHLIESGPSCRVLNRLLDLHDGLLQGVPHVVAVAARPASFPAVGRVGRGGHDLRRVEGRRGRLADAPPATSRRHQRGARRELSPRGA